MNTTDGSAHPAGRQRHAPDYRPWLQAALAGGGLYLLYRLFRGIGRAFWTVFGLALAIYWMGGGGFRW